jgi:hypothetical protein
MPEGRGADDRDTPEGVEHKQIIIAGNDGVCLAVHCEFQKLVIVRIAAARHVLSDGHRLGSSEHAANVIAETRRDIWRDARSPQNLDDFSLGRIGFQQPPYVSGQRRTIPGHDTRFSAALTKMLVSTTSRIRAAAAQPSALP